MNWQIQSALAGILAALGLYILFNPVTIVSLVTGVIPWLLIAAGAIYYVSIFLNARRRLMTMLLPGLIGTLLVYAGLSMKFGDSAAVGPVSLAFLFALLLFGTGVAKLLIAQPIRQSRYFLYILGSGVLSIVMGLLVLFNWSGVSASLIGVVLGLELLADAIVLGALALRDRDGEAIAELAGARSGASAPVAAAALVPPVGDDRPVD